MELSQRFLRLVVITVVGTLAVPIVTAACSLLGSFAPNPFTLGFLAALGVAVTILGWLALRVLPRVLPALDDAFASQSRFLDTLPDARIDLAIAGSAALSLFLELTVIRWQGTVFEFFAFYKNFSLLCCFAGLGLGYALAGRDRIPLAAVIPLLAWQFAFLTFFRHGMSGADLASVTSLPFREQLNMGVNAATTLGQGVATYFFLAVAFVLTALTFIPLGQTCGRLMKRRPNLRAYGLNLLGSVVGVGLTSAVSFLWTPPVVWYAISFIAILLLLPKRSASLTTAACGSLVALSILVWPVEPLWPKIYSPYQVLAVGHTNRGLMEIRAAGHYYQRVHDLGRAMSLGSDETRTRDYYDLPYKVHPSPAAVAVVGAGTGNDVAAAIRAGAEHVDAIEIDPAILALGRANHPERPYSQPSVSTIVNDARTFLRTTDRQYDMIVYGLLDSHTLLSHASSVRLDSFVYTVEGLRDARSRLKHGGVLALSFTLISNEIGAKISRMLATAFDGAAPACVQGRYDSSITFFQADRATPIHLPLDQLAGMQFGDCSGRFADPSVAIHASTDDWPFFYMPQRTYPVSYLVMIAVILAISFALISRFNQKPSMTHAPYFLLGAGFMLVETKGITEMGLVFGNTWHVIGIVISGILVMAFLANWAVRRFNIRVPSLPYALLLGSLGVGVMVARAGGFPSTALGQLAAVGLLTCPMLFSGMVFSTLLADEQDIAGAMSANLFGAMCGGLLEYNSMYFGFQFLYVLAVGLYAGAFVSSLLALKQAKVRLV